MEEELMPRDSAILYEELAISELLEWKAKEEKKRVVK